MALSLIAKVVGYVGSVVGTSAAAWEYAGYQEHALHRILHDVGLSKNPGPGWKPQNRVSKLLRAVGMKMGKEGPLGFHFHVHHSGANRNGGWDPGYGPAAHKLELKAMYPFTEGESQRSEKRMLGLNAAIHAGVFLALGQPYLALVTGAGAMYYYDLHKESHTDFDKAERQYSNHTMDHHLAPGKEYTLTGNMQVTGTEWDHVFHTRRIWAKSRIDEGPHAYKNKRDTLRERFFEKTEVFVPEMIPDLAEPSWLENLAQSDVYQSTFKRRKTSEKKK